MNPWGPLEIIDITMNMNTDTKEVKIIKRCQEYDMNAYKVIYLFPAKSLFLVPDRPGCGQVKSAIIK